MQQRPWTGAGAVMGSGGRLAACIGSCASPVAWTLARFPAPRRVGCTRVPSLPCCRPFLLSLLAGLVFCLFFTRRKTYFYLMTMVNQFQIHPWRLYYHG